MVVLLVVQCMVSFTSWGVTSGVTYLQALGLPLNMFYIISIVILLLQVRNFRRFLWLEWVFIIFGLFAFFCDTGFHGREVLSL